MRGIRAPGSPGFRARAQFSLAHPGRPYQHQIGAGKGVGPAQSAHRNVLRRPKSDAGQSLESVDLFFDVRCKAQDDAPLVDRRREGPQTPRASLHHSEGRDLERVGSGHSRGVRGDVSQSRERCGRLGAKRASPSPRQGGGRLDGHLLTQHRANAQFKAIECTRDS
jgi:hypothetical protein